MKLTKILGILLAVLLVTVGCAGAVSGAYYPHQVSISVGDIKYTEKDLADAKVILDYLHGQIKFWEEALQTIDDNGEERGNMAEAVCNAYPNSKACSDARERLNHVIVARGAAVSVLGYLYSQREIYSDLYNKIKADLDNA